MIKPLKQIFVEYKSNHKALPAFNIDSFEIYQAVEEAVRETNLPCLVEISPNEDRFIQAERLFLLVKKAQIDGLPIYLNMDHGNDLNRLEKIAHLGFDMVHFDGSKLDFEENLLTAQRFIGKIKSLNSEILIETEFNKISEAKDNPLNFTDPAQALDFISQTNTDLLAVSIGNQHGINLNNPEKIDLDLLKNIFAILPLDKFLTLHGGSGISLDQIKQTLQFGIVKININTELRLKFRESLQKNLSESASEKIYDYLNPVIIDLKQIIIEKLTQFSNA